MSGYLQRLLDRAAPHTPTVLPAGPSTSPLSQADQRLNDPGFADRTLPLPESAETLQERPPLPAGRPAPRSAPPPVPPAPTTAPFTEPTPGVPVATDLPRSPLAPPANAPAVPVSPAARHPRPVGDISDGDFEPPDVPAQDAVGPEAPPPAPAVLPPVPAPAEPSPPALTETPPIGDQAMGNPEPHSPNGAFRTPAPDAAPEVSPAPASADIPDPATASPSSAPAAAPAEPPIVVDLEPPAPVVPDLPDPPPRRDHAQAQHPSASEVAPPPAPPAAAAQAPPEAPVRRLPMTASEASIIGPLATRRRALTLFGQRRR